MKLDIRQDAIMPFNCERILTNEQMLMALKADHEIAGAYTGDAIIRMHPHDARIKLLARLRIPTRIERRIERQAVGCDLNTGDFGHGVCRFFERRERLVLIGSRQSAIEFSLSRLPIYDCQRPLFINRPDCLVVHIFIDRVRRAVAAKA